MVDKVQSKNAEDIAELPRKHTENIAELKRKHAEEIVTITAEITIFAKNHEVVATKIINKEQEKSASLIAKHAEEIAALNKRAKQTNDKNLEAWTELNDKYVESQLKVAKKEPDYNSYQA